MQIKSFYPKTIYQLTTDELTECENVIAIVRECPPVESSSRYVVMEQLLSVGVFYTENFANKFSELLLQKY